MSVKQIDLFYTISSKSKEETVLVYLINVFIMAEMFLFIISMFPPCRRGWSGSTMMLGKRPVPGRPTIWITIGQRPTVLGIGAGGECLDIFTLIYPFSPLSPSLWETVRYGLKYCLKGPLNPKQPTNHVGVRSSIYTVSAKKNRKQIWLFI